MLSCFSALAVVKNAAVNLGVHILLQGPDFNSFGCMPGSGIAGSYGSSSLSVSFCLESGFE
jgi:hypothetical protein